MLQAKTTIAAALAGILAAGTAAALANPPGGPALAPGGAEAHLERMTERLDLTDAQREEVRAILDAHRQSAEADRAQLREQIDAVLTDEQRALRDEQMQTRMERRLERMADRLDLTDTQREQVQAIMAEQRGDPAMTPADVREQIAAVLTDEQRQRLAQMRDRRGGGPDGGGRFKDLR